MGKLNLPTVDEIIDEAFKNILEKYGVKKLTQIPSDVSLSEIVNEVEEEANRLYKEYEKEAVIEYMRRKGYSKMRSAVRGVLKILENSLVITIANVRKSRGGHTVQRILAHILRRGYDIPCEVGKINLDGYEADIAIPNKEAVVKEKWGFALAVKRTLKERWREDSPVFKYPHSAFVFIKRGEGDFNLSKANDMVVQGFKLVYIPDEVYKEYGEELEKKYPGVFKRLSDLPADLNQFLKKKTCSTNASRNI